ncbi:hypothetical protein ACIQ1D_19585 [Lysinibacillus xylanilyticus]|uniref:hypothetical protein n=1 Tax=Lysinibacillus xylanilyticus TaxID=582475 RepID=UPI003818B8F2
MTKYNGMTQEQIIQEVKQAYSDFRSTFEKSSELVVMNEVTKAWEKLQVVINETISLVSEERSYWYQYREHNTAWSEWENVDKTIRQVNSEAWGIVESKDWREYKAV